MKRILVVISVGLAACIFSCNPSKKTTTNSTPSSGTNSTQTDTSTNMNNNTDSTHHR